MEKGQILFLGVEEIGGEDKNSWPKYKNTQSRQKVAERKTDYECEGEASKPHIYSW
jgi:hypothetical protein